jgi:ParB family chromosome partitioning protein
VQQRVAAGVLSAGHARAILSVDDPERMQQLADKVVNEDLSVRATEAAAKTLPTAPGSRTKPQAGARRAYLDEVSSKLGDRLNTRVQIALGARKGQIKIEFASIQDLNRILADLGEDEYGNR